MRKKKHYIGISLLAVMILLSVCCFLHWGSVQLTCVSYEVDSTIEKPLRLVQLTDLHSYTFGENNGELVALVAAQEPDLILMTGDMLDRSDENADVVCALIKDLCAVAPVYYGYGNHEYNWMHNHGRSLTPALEAAGATVLDVAYQDITVNGQLLRIGGYHGYYRYTGMIKTTEEDAKRQNGFFDDFEDTDRYKILLGHIPTPWLDWGNIDEFPVDLVLSGHYHGGQVQLPIIGGVYAPYVGFFPEYTEGIYRGEQATCILSTGLGASPGIPRINNPSQVIVIDLIPEHS